MFECLSLTESLCAELESLQILSVFDMLMERNRGKAFIPAELQKLIVQHCQGFMPSTSSTIRRACR